jgi:hypothetical protein
VNVRSWAVAILSLAAAAVAAGCQAPSAPAAKAQKAADSELLDPVAQRMHDICGQILLFHGSHSRLPTSLAELCQAGGMDGRQVLDPSTGRAFAYAPAGLADVAGAGKIIAAAAPGGAARWRWCIAFRETNGSAVCTVVPVPSEKLGPADRSASAP